MSEKAKRRGSEAEPAQKRMRPALTDDDRKVLQKAIQERFSLRAPEEMFAVMECCASIDPCQPMTALREFHVELTGPFRLVNDYMSAHELPPHTDDLDERFFYDMPEVCVVMKRTDQGEQPMHWAYFRDEPDEEPISVVANKPSEGSTFHVASESLIGSIVAHCSRAEKQAAHKKDTKE
mmetsp:Transcript_31359/g.91013  ORF Transcript_31359/g.91013 Transcript_31359/m.91013 type:complete len:179 (+) Transcript_31359:86-622(+)